jgi:glycosyltransferase involved in cell wall biosynthesis
MPTVGYFPYVATVCSAEAGWLGQHLPVTVRVADGVPSLNDGSLPAFEHLAGALKAFLALPAVVVEGPGGFLWAALLRAHGFAGNVTVLPYINPLRWSDVAAIAVYRRFADPGDRVFLGSRPSAAVYRALGVQASVGEPYGVDDGIFGVRRDAAQTRDKLSIPPGRLLLFAGRAQPDKDLYRLLRAGLKARVLFPDLQVVMASHVVDHAYLSAARVHLDSGSGVHFVVDPAPGQLADLYNVADVFVTASTSHFETFGRAPAEALACGSPSLAPRYDGFVEVLAQPGGTLVDVEVDLETGIPYVPENLLLRSIYEVLSCPRPPERQEVAAIARRRFGRSSTIGLLGYLADGALRPPPAPIPPAAIELPAEWRGPLAEIANRGALDALAWFWNSCNHERLAAHDEDFTAAVRRSLCVPRLGADQGLIACP